MLSEEIVPSADAAIIENFAKMLKVLCEKFETAKSCHFRGCKFCISIYSNFSMAKKKGQVTAG